MSLAESPYLTPNLPGIGGVIKQSPDDFEVDEISAYEPSGEGEHLFLKIEKRDVAAEQLTRHVARALGISNRDVGVAGLKDRRAVTRQYLSVPAQCEESVATIETEAIRVLSVQRHGNKLRSGHLQGNRFSILVRDVNNDAIQRAESIAERIVECGFPNYFGSQRFGHGGDNVQMGFDLLTGKTSPNRIPRSRRRFLLRMSLSAAQSHLFNLCLAERLNDRLLERVLPGDVMQVVASGGTFVVEDESTEQGRFDMGETVTTGPIFGPKMTQPTGETALQEARLLESHQLSLDNFIRHRKLTLGTRRPFLVRPRDFTVEAEPNGLRFRFTLPPGTYATLLLREFQKVDPGPLATANNPLTPDIN